MKLRIVFVVSRESFDDSNSSNTATSNPGSAAAPEPARNQAPSPQKKKRKVSRSQSIPAQVKIALCILYIIFQYAGLAYSLVNIHVYHIFLQYKLVELFETISTPVNVGVLSRSTQKAQ